ncbi:MAG: tripartite tricarboxylate transporter substrate binding protein [Candidatus Marinimicrobia bacterium]|nr:tripartite tricarboxylate transporter substrate binding protein [Candidatus Neomarinimicrobiota bacterium]
MVSNKKLLTYNRLFLVFSLAFLLLLSSCGSDSGFPNRPITLICPWSAGGGSDRVARQLASQLERQLDVPVNVVNATGGAGVTGHTRGALARPDGYTITLITAELNMLHWRGLTNITYEDYDPVMQVNRDYAAVFVRADSEWETIEQLEQSIRENPGELKASGTAFGGIWHVSLAGWLLEAGMNPDDVIWISINGSAPSLQELLAGGVDMVSCSVPEARALLDAGRIRCLTVMSDERLDAIPDVPTLQESGIDWVSQTWRGLAAPDGVPEDRFSVLVQASEEVVNSEEYLNFLEQAGFGAAALGPEEFTEELEVTDKKYGAIFNSEAFESMRRQRYGPMLFPNILFIAIGLTLLTLIFTGNLKLPEEAQELHKEGLIRIAGTIGAVIVYLLIAEITGYVIASALILAGLFWQLQVKWYVAALIILIFIPLTYQVFGVYLRVPLPWGWLGW